MSDESITREPEFSDSAGGQSCEVCKRVHSSTEVCLIEPTTVPSAVRVPTFSYPQTTANPNRTQK